MKKALSVLLSLSLLVRLAVPAYAADFDFDHWVPPIPPFVDFGNEPSYLDLGDVSFNGFFGRTPFLYKPSVLLLSQENFSYTNEVNGTDYDRQFCVYYVQMDTSVAVNGKTCYFRHDYCAKRYQRITTPNPMIFGSYVPFTFTKCIYDYNSKKLVMQPGTYTGSAGGQIRFTYVLNSSDLTRPSDLYPGFSEFEYSYPDKAGSGTAPFETSTIYYDDEVPHYGEEDYKWWLYTVHRPVSGKPEGSGSGSGGGSTSGGGSEGGSTSGGGSEGGSTSGGGSEGGSTSGGGSEGGSTSGGGSEGGSTSGGGSEGGSTSGGGSEGGSTSGGGSEGGGSEGGGSKPGGDDGPGSGGGSSSDKGSGHPDTWFDKSDGGVSYDPWEFFDPFKSNYDPVPWDKNYSPTKPGDSIYNGYDPFAVFNNLLKEMFGG